MKKFPVAMMSMAVVIVGIGTAAAQGSNFAPKGQALDIGVHTEPTKVTCEPIGTGVWDCTQTFCKQVGANQSNECKTYRFIVNNGKEE